MRRQGLPNLKPTPFLSLRISPTTSPSPTTQGDSRLRSVTDLHPRITKDTPLEVLSCQTQEPVDLNLVLTVQGYSCPGGGPCLDTRTVDESPFLVRTVYSH